MADPILPSDEANRLAALRDYEILDTLPEEVYDRLVAVASEVCDTPIALFSLVDDKRQWFKARVGLEVEETARELSFCAHAIAANHELLVDDTLQDAHFVDNALVIGTPNIRFYYGVPVRSHGGHPLGTLCVIDRIPRTLTDQQRMRLGELARQIETHLELRRTNRELNQLMDERAVMSSMIAHDARNLMMRVIGELEPLSGRMLPDDAASLDRARDAVGQMLRMCENFVDLNKGSVPPVLAVTPAPTDLDAWLKALVRRETQRAWSESVTLDARCELAQPVYRTDAALLERLLLNLLDNAYRAAPADTSVGLDLKSRADGGLVLTVKDRGPGMPESLKERIFEPFFSSQPAGRSGTGLGLAFCRLAAKALGGELVHETPPEGGTQFRLELPGG